MTEAEQELWADVQPEFASMHELRSDLPVECITISSPSFGGSHWSMVLNEPGRLGARHRPTSPSTGRCSSRCSTATAPAVGAEDPRLPLHARRPARRLPRRQCLHPPRPGQDDALDGQHDGDGAVAAHRRRASSTSSPTLIGALFGAPSTPSPGGATTARSPAPCGDVRFADLMADPVAAIGARTPRSVESRPARTRASPTTWPPSPAGSTASTATRRRTGASTSTRCGGTWPPTSSASPSRWRAERSRVRRASRRGRPRRRGCRWGPRGA